MGSTAFYSDSFTFYYLNICCMELRSISFRADIDTVQNLVENIILYYPLHQLFVFLGV
jgi:hypothetical protein